MKGGKSCRGGQIFRKRKPAIIFEIAGMLSVERINVLFLAVTQRTRTRSHEAT